MPSTEASSIKVWVTNDRDSTKAQQAGPHGTPLKDTDSFDGARIGAQTDGGAPVGRRHRSGNVGPPLAARRRHTKERRSWAKCPGNQRSKNGRSAPRCRPDKARPRAAPKSTAPRIARPRAAPKKRVFALPGARTAQNPPGCLPGCNHLAVCDIYIVSQTVFGGTYETDALPADGAPAGRAPFRLPAVAGCPNSRAEKPGEFAAGCQPAESRKP